MEPSRTGNGRWKTFEKRLRNVFRRTAVSPETAEGGEPSATGRCRRPNNGETSATWQDDDDGWDGDRNDGEDGDSAAPRVRMAELKLDIVNVLYAESKRKNERAMAWLSEAKHENCRLSIVVCELETKLSELARQAAGAERCAERRAEQAERRAEQADRQAEQAERRAERMAREAAEQRSVLSRAMADLKDVLSSRVADL